MTKILYINFLENKQIYHLAEGFWKRFFDRYSKKVDLDYQEYLNKKYANGRKFYNGNPIFDAYFPKLNKAVRIIQEEPGNAELEIGAWIKELEIEEKHIKGKELVIDLVLSKESQEIANRLVHAWLVEDLDDQNMQRSIDENIEPAIAG